MLPERESATQDREPREAVAVHEANTERARAQLARIYAALHRAAPPACDRDLSDLPEQVERVLHGYGTEMHEAEQVLGKALGFPPYGPEMFPDGNPNGDVCVGEHTLPSLADEAAERLSRAEAELEEARTRIARQNEQLNRRPRVSSMLAWKAFRAAMRHMRRYREQNELLRSEVGELRAELQRRRLGLCGSRSPRPNVGGVEYRRRCCVLDAEHLGWHKDDEGVSWSPHPDPELELAILHDTILPLALQCSRLLAKLRPARLPDQLAATTVLAQLSEAVARLDDAKRPPDEAEMIQ